MGQIEPKVGFHPIEGCFQGVSTVILKILLKEKCSKYYLLGRQHVLDGSADHQLVLVGHLDAHVREERVDNLFTAQQQLVHVVDGVPDR